MKQSEMIAVLKELRSDLLRNAAGSDSIVPGAYAEALDAAIDFLNSGSGRILTGEWIYDSNTDEPRCSECGEMRWKEL